MTKLTEGQKLRKRIADIMRAHGPQENGELADRLKMDPSMVRTALMNMRKAGLVRSDRPVGGTHAAGPVRYGLVIQMETPRNVAKPHRPVVKEWAPHGRDPLALPDEFFKVRAA